MIQENWTSLIRPKFVEVDRSTLTPVYGRFVAKPLERGFGHTVGNGLRRILLSSLQGCAITGIKFDGVLHEFSTINDVTEDMVDIILNLKGVRARLSGVSQKTVVIDKKGPGILTAADLGVDDSIQILNVINKIMKDSFASTLLSPKYEHLSGVINHCLVILRDEGELDPKQGHLLDCLVNLVPAFSMMRTKLKTTNKLVEIVRS